MPFSGLTPPHLLATGPGPSVLSAASSHLLHGAETQHTLLLHGRVTCREKAPAAHTPSSLLGDTDWIAAPAGRPARTQDGAACSSCTIVYQWPGPTPGAVPLCKVVVSYVPSCVQELFFMYICSTEEVVTDKGCGHRLPPWLVFSWTPLCPLTPARHPSSRPARSLQHPTSARFAAQLPCPTPACAAPARFRGWELTGFPPR